MKSIIYGRVSTQNQSFERQQQELRDYCFKENFEVVGEYFETESGTHEVRNELTKMFSHLENDSIDYVVIWEISRLGRTNEIINSINRIHKSGCGLISRKESIKTNVKDENGLIMANLLITFLSGINTFELSTFKSRSMSGLKRNVKKGGVIGSINYPYGYMNENKMLVVNETESYWIKKMFELYLAGNGTSKIAQYLNENNVQTRSEMNVKIRNKKNEEIINENLDKKLNDSKYNFKMKWVSGTVYAILKNTLYKGIRKYKGEEIHQESLKIIEPEIFDLVNERMKGNYNKNDKHTKNEYIIDRFKIFCGECGLTYYAHQRQPKDGKVSRDNRYICLSNRYKYDNKTKLNICSNPSIGIPKMENLIHHCIFYLMSEKLVQILDDSEINSKLEKLEIEETNINNELKQLEKVQENIFNWMLNKTFDSYFLNNKLTEYNNNKKETTEKLNEIIVKRNSLKLAKENLNNIEQLKNDYIKGQKLSKEIVNKIIKKIIITEEKDFINTLTGVLIFNNFKGDKVLQVRIITENDTELEFYISQRTNFILLKTVSGFLRMNDFFDGSAPRKMFDFLTADY